MPRFRPRIRCQRQPATVRPRHYQQLRKQQVWHRARLKINPGHDPNNYKTKKRHPQPVTSAMHQNGTMNAVCDARYNGLDRLDAHARLWGGHLGR